MHSRDPIYVLSGVNGIAGGWKMSYQRNLFTNELCTDRQILYGNDAVLAAT